MLQVTCDFVILLRFVFRLSLKLTRAVGGLSENLGTGSQLPTYPKGNFFPFKYKSKANQELKFCENKLKLDIGQLNICISKAIVSQCTCNFVTIWWLLRSDLVKPGVDKVFV